MSRSALVLSAAVGLFVGGQVAYGERQIVSYFGDWGGGGQQVIVDPVPDGGFVLTDVVIGESAGTLLSLYQVIGEDSDVKMRMLYSESLVYHFNAGIPFDAGSQVAMAPDPSGTGQVSVTLSGYIPSPTLKGNVPAVGTWGLGVMVLLLFVAATLMMRRRQVVA